MTKRNPYVLALTMLACAACGGSTSGGGSGGSAGGQGGSGGAGNTSGSGGAGNSGGSGGSGGSATLCGGLAGGTCKASELCDYTPNLCGADDGTGTCSPRPDNCPDIYQPTCGCDGVVHSSPCDTQASGVDLAESGGCAPPAGYFPCGPTFCEGAASYCEKVTDDTGGPDQYTCQVLPAACVGQADCGCFTSATACSDVCEVVFGNGPYGFVLTCPGG